MTPDWYPEDEPFLRPHALRTSDLLTEAAVHVLKDYPRARVIELLCIVFSKRWQHWTGPDREHDLPTRLPRIAGERHGVRVMRALMELARGEHASGRSTPALFLAGVVQRERDVLGVELDRICSRRVSDHELARVHALVTGLRLALVDAPPEDTSHLTWDAAAAILRREIARLVVDNQPARDTSPGTER